MHNSEIDEKRGCNEEITFKFKMTGSTDPVIIEIELLFYPFSV